MFAYYQKLIEMRKTHPAILDGDLRFYLEEDPQLLVYTRSCARQTLLVVANKSDEPATFCLPEALQASKWESVLGNYLDSPTAIAETLRPWECIVYELKG